jgi:ribosomal protein L1
MSKYFAGKDCSCAAYSESECACGADWIDSEVYELREKIAKLESALIRLRDCDWVITLPDRMDGVRKIAREALIELEKPNE